MAFYGDMEERVLLELQNTLNLNKDGNVHVLMINSFSKLINKSFGFENKYTYEIDYIVAALQKQGYEIIDIKFNSLMNQGLLGDREGFHTLIIYRYVLAPNELRAQQIQQIAPKQETICKDPPMSNTAESSAPDSRRFRCKLCDAVVTEEFVDSGYSCLSCGVRCFSPVIPEK